MADYTGLAGVTSFIMSEYFTACFFAYVRSETRQSENSLRAERWWEKVRNLDMKFGRNLEKIVELSPLCNSRIRHT